MRLGRPSLNSMDLCKLWSEWRVGGEALLVQGSSSVPTYTIHRNALNDTWRTVLRGRAAVPRARRGHSPASKYSGAVPCIPCPARCLPHQACHSVSRPAASSLNLELVHGASWLQPCAPRPPSTTYTQPDRARFASRYCSLPAAFTATNRRKPQRVVWLPGTQRHDWPLTRVSSVSLQHHCDPAIPRPQSSAPLGGCSCQHHVAGPPGRRPGEHVWPVHASAWQQAVLASPAQDVEHAEPIRHVPAPRSLASELLSVLGLQRLLYIVARIRAPTERLRFAPVLDHL